MGSQWPCCWGGRHSLSPPARPALRLPRMRPALRAGPARRRADVVRRPRRPAAAGGGQISTKQRVPVKAPGRPVRGIFPPLRPRAAQAAGRQQRRRRRRRQPRTREAGSLGSGFIISPDGYIVTNNHLDPGRDRHGDGRQVTVITTDRRNIRRASSAATRRPTLPCSRSRAATCRIVHWGDSTKARVGDWIVAIGNPYGARRNRHGRHHFGASPRDHRRRRLRPLHPDRRGHQHGQ